MLTATIAVMAPRNMNGLQLMRAWDYVGLVWVCGGVWLWVFCISCPRKFWSMV